MHIKKVLATRIDLMTPHEIYHPNMDKQLMNVLTEKYCGKCYKGCLIESIVRIIRRSFVNQVYERLDGSAFVNVQFEVLGIIYENGEIVHGAPITCIQNDIISASKPGLEIMIALDADQQEMTQYLEKGNIIPLEINSVRYVPNAPVITVRASPFRPAKPSMLMPRYFNCSSYLTDDERTQLLNLKQRANTCFSEYKELSVKNKHISDLFPTLLYPYRNVHKTEPGIDFKEVNLLNEDILEPVKCLVKYSETAVESGIVYKAPNYIEDGIYSSQFTVIGTLLQEFIMHINNLINFHKTYPTEKDLEKIKFFWKTYLALKPI